MNEVKGLKERLGHVEPALYGVRCSTYISGGYAAETQVQPIDAVVGTPRNPDGPEALAYIADLEAKLAVAREAITDAIDAYGKWTGKTCKQERADSALLSALNTIGEDHG